MKMKLVWLVLLLAFGNVAHARIIEVQEGTPVVIRGESISILEDPSGNLRFSDILRNQKKFEQFEGEVPNLQYSYSAFWLRIELYNASKDSLLAIEASNTQLDTLDVYIFGAEGTKSYRLGDVYRFDQRLFNHQHFIVPFQAKPGEKLTIYLRVRGLEQMSIPLLVGQRKHILTNNYQTDLFAGLYFGIMLVMFFYNLFLYISIRDKAYLFYILYIAGIALAQASLQGYTFKYLLPNFPYLNHLSVVLFSTLTGIGAIQFARIFLRLKKELPSIDFGLRIFEALYLLAPIVFLFGWRQFSYNLLDFSALILSFYALYFSIRLSLKGQRTAKFFLFAWSFFMIGMFVFVARNLGWLPYNFFTKNVLLMGSALEAILLSVALADRINILKREKEISQAEALRISLENERLVREQNLVLEAKVQERTEALQNANKELGLAIDNLKSTQTQLVNAEKMASLGQLTAGIAHEINNPINFVTSNIIPLRRDLSDLMELLNQYDLLHSAPGDHENELKAIKKLQRDLDYDFLKEEIGILLNGMEEGAKRTAEIVKGLRIFSRLDESDLKKVNINEGIESTLILLNSSMGGKIDLVKDYDPDAYLECYPGKLNQVIMNITNNAIQALHEHVHDKRGQITIHTKALADTIRISISDNGPGIPETIRSKIFEPFFTTKAVGQGTGLGLSIVYSIIESHKGQIHVFSNPGEGTTFQIDLPKLQS